MEVPPTQPELPVSHLLTLLNIISDAFVVVDRQWRYLYINAPAAKFIGRNPSELIDKTIWQEFANMIDTALYQELQQAMEHRSSRRFEFEDIERGRWFENEAYPLQDGLLIIFRDITGRKRADTIIARQTDQLRESEDLATRRMAELETIYREAPIGLCVLDPQFRYIRTNDRLAEMNGLPAQSHIGRTVREIVPQVADEAERILRQLLETGQPVIGLEISGQTLAHPGERRTWRESFFPIRTPDGQVIGINVVAEDVTDQLRKQQQLRELAFELSRAEDRERKRLAAAMHDNLSQLLAVSVMRLERVERNNDIAQLRQTVMAVKGILDEALETARTLMEDLRPPLLGHDDDLKAALNWVANKMRRHGLSVSFSDYGEPKALDEDVLIVTYQAVQELLWNVVKHAGTSEARVCIDRSAETVEILVEDYGRGFDSAHPPVPKEGGFGLFSFRERLDLVGGQLQVTAVPHQGTRARITVPLKSEKTGALSTKARPSEGTIGDGKNLQKDSPERIRVLLVDDHPVMRNGLRQVIEDQCDMWVIGEAADGQSAVQLAGEIIPDVVVMDINLPIMNGIEATRQIKTQHPSMTVIGLSMHDNVQMAEAIQQAGAAHYISKGAAAHTLCAVIRSAINQEYTPNA